MLAGGTAVLAHDGQRWVQVQFWHHGKDDWLYCMLPHSVPAPCWARQVFTTVHDNEETVRFAICVGVR